MKRDDESFTEFAAVARRGLRNTAYLLCGDWDRASDFVQEGLIRVYVAWPRLEKKEGGLAAYAHRALHSAVIDHHRKHIRREKNEDRVPVVTSVGDGTAEHADREVLVQALKALPERQRACVVLRYFEDLSIADTAAALKCSIGTIKSQTSHGLRALKAELTRLGGADVLELGGEA
jgi:RNA polymerase sigma-70 factor (sigma-E family)